MAQINLEEFKRIDKERNSVHSKVPSSYCVFEDSGEKYLQIDTYGKTGRVMPGKESQSFQFDKQTAKYLINLLIKEFDLKY